MPGLFKNKYRNDSARLKQFDYSSSGYYFVTICTYNKTDFFGDVTNGKIKLSEIGKIAHESWTNIPHHFGNAQLDEFIIMPDHLHGILFLDQPYPCRDAINRVPTIAWDKHGGATGSHNPMLTNNSLGKIIRWFKGRTTFEIRKSNHFGFAWQPRFYEHVVRNENSLQKIREYIVNNPINWHEK